MEKAISLNADDPLLEIQLGDAYLNLGKDDLAMSAYDHAIDLAATPVVWNNIAYQLSLKKVHLERAQQYAESAVAATVAAARNLSLEQLNQRDLGTVQSLAAYWDTLGWVYFAKGDMAKAEKYLTAAWRLAQHSDIADHLGQFYEKEGHKDDAVRSYAWALSVMRPVPEARTHLAALVGEKQVDATISRYHDDPQMSRTIKLGKIAKESGSAEFFLMLSGAGPAVNVDAVKFVSGDEKLKLFTEALRTAKYNAQFPDDMPTRILRRGILSCSKTTGDCSFVLMLPQDVVSVD